MLSASPLILLAAILLIAGVLLSKTSSRLGVPSLLLFLVLGMLAGSEGVFRVAFEDFEVAQRYGIIALAFILFSGGAGTAWRDIRTPYVDIARSQKQRASRLPPSGDGPRVTWLLVFS